MPLVCYFDPLVGYEVCIQVPNYNQGGTFQPTSTILPSSNGGIFAETEVCLYPCLNVVTNKMEYRTFDTTQTQNDPVNPSSYMWRVEQIKAYRNPTVRRILWTYMDLGQVSVTWTATGTNENQQAVSASTSLGVGNNPATKQMMTVEVDLVLTAMNLQLSVSKAAGAGPLSVVKVVMVGEYEETVL